MGQSNSTPDDGHDGSSECPIRAKSGSCPVDGSVDGLHHMANSNQKPSPGQPFALPTSRSVSSIPKANPKDNESKNWVYPSEQQFWNAMIKKGWRWQSEDINHNDIKQIVRIHNENNERAWAELLKWEMLGGHDPSAVKLSRFHGDAKKLSPRARFRCLLGYEAPFDRHDWVIERDGKEIRYVLDYYDIGNEEQHKQGDFIFTDVRPALDSFWAVKIRTKAFILRHLSSWIPPEYIAKFKKINEDIFKKSD
ncbi:Cytochrome c-type heme lyase [Thelohanellus kitauei]|uniref:Holocytochrome c-type synthase n=1 Tax=Thelohanellus kitauei TaxID=669202 RepID=A0A0C2JTG9_THEKT|nr:Cytochrome c-type heme lyase [Thelohanellus kitauei]